MAGFSNREILSAVLVKWAQPAIQSLAGTKLMQLPMLANIEAKVRSTGWVSPMWKLGNEIAPLIGGISSRVIEPFISNYLQGVPDEAIPVVAHTIVENALKQGSISLLEDNVVFEREDLEELQRLLRYNLPIVEGKSYEVLEREPIPQGVVAETNK